MLDFWDESNTQSLTQQIEASGGRFAVAVHPYFNPVHLAESQEVLSGMVNTPKTLVPPLLVVEGASYVEYTDTKIAEILTPTSRPVYMLRSIDRMGLPLPSDASIKDLAANGIISVSNIPDAKGKLVRRLEFVEGEKSLDGRESLYNVADAGAVEFIERLKSIGVKTAIVGGMNLRLRSTTPEYKFVEVGEKAFWEQRQLEGAKVPVYPGNCVGMMIQILSPDFEVKVSNFSRPHNRSTLERFESTPYPGEQ